MELPDWLRIMFSYGNSRCPKCNRLTGPEDIECLGVHRPQPHDISPLGAVIVICPHCKERVKFLDTHTLADLTEAVDAVYRHFETVIRPDKFFFPRPPTAASPAGTTTDASSEGVRPSVPSGKGGKPITNGEVQSFKRTLEKTAFRPNSKSFQNLLRRWGVSLEGEGGGDAAPSAGPPKARRKRKDSPKGDSE